MVRHANIHLSLFISESSKIEESYAFRGFLLQQIIFRLSGRGGEGYAPAADRQTVWAQWVY